MKDISPLNLGLSKKLLDGSGISGGSSSGIDVSISLARNPDALISGTITRDANGAAISAPVTWPDGATGVYTATSVSATFPGAVDAYTITHVLGSTTTYTQPLLTRDGNGAVTNLPAITVS